MNYPKAIFAAGCFWGVEETFRTLEGVQNTKVGYTGGHTDNPDYRSVCRGDTEHAEAVEVVFDPAVISYSQLLDIFLQCHDPTQIDRQGVDVGRQYRSAIFVTDKNQRAEAEDSKASAQAHFPRPIATEILDAETFYDAEEYHQQYVMKKRSSGFFR